MNEIQAFNSLEFGQIRTINIEGEPWFIGKDIAAALGYKDTSDAIKRHIFNEDKLTRCFTDSGQGREMTIINESGMYSLVLSSKLEKAKLFKRWITNDILPSIRKHGMYATDELVNNPDLLIQVATQLKDERTKRQQLELKEQENRPKVLFAESVEASKCSILIGDLAKLIKQNGYNIGQNRLFEWMRNNGYLISRRGESYNMPTQQSMNLGLFEIKESSVVNPDGSVRLTRTTKVTGKGQVYFINKFIERN
ncbi:MULTISPECIES: phage antirepressor [Peptostreptococcus]|uniref:phage antirepressor n=1 Tax=Peptostreptococcus TaxID=1257 RepID=UPI002910792B|nr:MULTISPECIES: phage antirepressor KilAC domain-containing protein [Peptostreptococcus]MDU3423143.1 phage antirepressor KilAC domain-containing protein [Peptostreptococcus anaerobius]MDU3430442.1 phage antirepressor KilAC domain-containing protein [Peptostreptococcus sp.]MDU3455430.1 phage antirepressor KilAC domain-containing protein [Peptostreptococcus sp.]MDU5987172.1 phage antirepressor KilAC domain-containing protein [Peptostreptococcus anaerobius]